MTTTTDITVHTGGALAIGAEQTEWTQEQLAVLRSVGVDKDVIAAELAAFLHESQRTGLDPFSKQIYLIGRYDNREQRKVFRSQTGIDGYRVVAHRAARRDRVELEYDDTLWCGPDRKWCDVWLESYPPSAAKVVVRKNGKPFPGVATLTEYAALDRNNNPTPMWRKMPASMLAKCAEALALRKAFPHDLSGIYTAEEMEQADARSAEPRELTVQQVTERMRRNAPQDDDAWTGDPSEPASDPKPAAVKRIQAVLILARQKWGPLTRDERMDRLSEMVGRKVPSSKALTFDEAQRVMAALEELPDHAADIDDAEVVDEPTEPTPPAPNPRNGGGEPVDLAPTIGPAALAADLMAAIESAATREELDIVGQAIASARDAQRLMPQDRDRLGKAWSRRARQLRPVGEADPSWAERRMAEMEQRADEMAGADA
jgi:phage recombination protein Bet